MSIESTRQLLREYHEAWNRGDQEAGIGFFAEDLIVHMGGNGPLAGQYRGRDAFVNNWIGRVNAYVDRWEVGDEDEILLVGEDGVLMMVHELWGKADRSVKTDRLAFYRFKDDKIVECHFSDMNQAEVEDFFGDLT